MFRIDPLTVLDAGKHHWNIRAAAYKVASKDIEKEAEAIKKQ